MEDCPAKPLTQHISYNQWLASQYKTSNRKTYLILTNPLEVQRLQIHFMK